MTGISKIDRSPLPFSCLTISDETKSVIMALTVNRMDPEANVQFDDFISGKGRGLNLLLKCGFEALLHVHILIQE